MMRIIGSLVAVAVTVPAATATWTVTPIVAVPGGGGFADVDAVSATDALAVGGQTAERWNGTRWAATPVPDLIDDHSNPNNWATLYGVDASSSTSAFAVGRYAFFGPTSGDNAIALRWNGTAWSRMTVPNPAGSDYSLYGVKAFSASDAWAVGSTEPTTLSQPLAMHWNGTNWAQVTTPVPGTQDNFLYAVDGAAANDVWAVGYSRNLPYGNRDRQSVVLHWNGTNWTQVPSPNISRQTVLNDVLALSANDVWAVGYSNGPTTALVLHWDGTAWTVASAPALNVLSGVTALSPTNIWAAGIDSTGAAYLANWTPAGWTTTPMPIPGGSTAPSPGKLSALAPSTVWAVGRVDDAGGVSQPLAVRTTNG